MSKKKKRFLIKFKYIIILYLTLFRKGIIAYVLLVNIITYLNLIIKHNVKYQYISVLSFTFYFFRIREENRIEIFKTSRGTWIVGLVLDDIFLRRKYWTILTREIFEVSHGQRVNLV
jgi:hypothetical protein